MIGEVGRGEEAWMWAFGRGVGAFLGVDLCEGLRHRRMYNFLVVVFNMLTVYVR